MGCETTYNMQGWLTTEFLSLAACISGPLAWYICFANLIDGMTQVSRPIDWYNDFVQCLILLLYTLHDLSFAGMESERLTFYEDLYLSRSDYTKTGTLPSRIYTNRDYQRIPSSWRTQSKPPRIRTQQPSPVATVKQAISPTPVAHSNSRSPNSTKNNHR